MNIVEVQAMKQEITATEILENLNKDGYVALYINFDTGKANIKEDSNPLIDEVAVMLKTNPDLKLSVEGHTDNTGDAKVNKALSFQRADAVLKAMVSKGISAGNLSSAG